MNAKRSMTSRGVVERVLNFIHNEKNLPGRFIATNTAHGLGTGAVGMLAMYIFVMVTCFS